MSKVTDSLQARLMGVRPRLLARAFQSFAQSVQLILKLTEFRLFDPQSIFRIGYPCLDFSLCICVSIEPCFYLSEGIFEVLLFRCRSLSAAFLLLDLFHTDCTVVLLKTNLSEP